MTVAIKRTTPRTPNRLANRSENCAVLRTPLLPRTERVILELSVLTEERASCLSFGLAWVVVDRECPFRKEVCNLPLGPSEASEVDRDADGRVMAAPAD